MAGSGGGWEFTLFQTTGDKPSAAFVEAQRAAFRAAIDHLGLQLVEIEPAAEAAHDERRASGGEYRLARRGGRG